MDWFYEGRNVALKEIEDVEAELTKQMASNPRTAGSRDEYPEAVNSLARKRRQLMWDFEIRDAEEKSALEPHEPNLSLSVLFDS